MYLSKLLLDLRNRQVQREIGNRYELHRTLTAQFPEENRKEIGLLYRLEMINHSRNNELTLLVQTQLEPQWNALFKAGMLTLNPELKFFEVDFFQDDCFYFRLLGNPTMRKSQSDGKSKRVGLYTPEEQQAWLARKASQSGFEVVGANLRDLGLIESIKKKNDKSYMIKHLAVQFDGLLKVTNPNKLTSALKNGIGSAKAFGFGLLSLAKFVT